MAASSAASASARDDHDHHDGCVCDHDLAEHEETADHDLPEAAGGVEAPKPARRRGGKARIAEGDA